MDVSLSKFPLGKGRSMFHGQRSEYDKCHSVTMTFNHVFQFYLREKNTPKTQWRKSTQFRQISLFRLDPTQEIYIPNDSQETNLQTYTRIFSLEVKMVEILTDLNRT